MIRLHKIELKIDCVHFNHTISTCPDSGSGKYCLGKDSQTNINLTHVRDDSQRESIFHLQRS